MTAVLTDNLPLVSGSPNGIGKIRQLILALAVQGRLVAQDRSEEGAAALLEATKVARNKLAKNQDEVVVSDGDSQRPYGWARCSLANLAIKLTDGSHNPPADAGTGFPMLSSQNVRDGFIDFSSPSRFLSPEGFEKENARTRTSPGDVLLTIVASIGRSAVIPDDAPQFALQRSVAVISTLMLPAYLCVFLRSPTSVSYYWKHAAGTAQKGIYLGKLGELTIEIPPLAEQHRIVAKVDELMVLCDTLETQQTNAESAHAQLVQALLDSLTQASYADDFAASWQRLSEHFDTLFTTEASIDALKQTVLQLAVMGKLVPQDPNDEPASHYYSRKLEIPQAYARSGKQKIKDPAMASMDGLSNIPDAWIYKTVNELYESGHLIDYADGNHGSLYPRKEEFSNSGVLFLTAAQITEGGAIMWDRCPKLSREKASHLSKGWSQLGDVFYTHNATVGRASASSDGPQERFLLGTSVTFYRVNPKAIIADYLYRYFCSSSWASQAESVMRQTTRNQVSITKQALFYIALPPRAEQLRIAARVDALMSLCDQLKSRIRQARDLNQQLASTLVERAVA